MAQLLPPHETQAAGFAYRLGYTPLKLEIEARWHWILADMDWPFPAFLAGNAGVIRTASQELSQHLPARNRAHLTSALQTAAEHAWAEFEAAWLGPYHRERIEERDRDRYEGHIVDMV